MIGRPVQPINHVCLADDYNKLVDVIRPYQNLTLGQGLIGNFSNTGISISVARQASDAVFNYPFKVTSDSLSSATIQFGRVFEERNFKGDEAYIANLSFIELSSSVTFDTTSGMTLDLDPQLDVDAIVIAVDASHEISLDNKFYQVCLSSDIPASYYPAHLIANLTKETSSTSWNVEQILMGDYTFDRNPPVPFDITRYGDKWLIYLPVNSLVINGVDYTLYIGGLTNGATPIVGSWYEITTDNYNYLQIEYGSGTGYGSVCKVTMQAPNSSYEQIALWDVGGPGEITYQYIKGSLHLEKIRPDSGDNYSVSKSIARQNASDGIVPGQSDYTIELHGFYEGQEILGTLTNDESYTHKIPIREEEISTGNKVLRWTDVANLSAITGSGNTFDFPWKVIPNRDPMGPGGVSIFLGRVYEIGAFEDSSTTDRPLNIMEIDSYYGTPGVWIDNIGTDTTDSYVCVVQNPSIEGNKKFDLLPEEYALANGYHVIRRLAKVYKVSSEEISSIEQIQMGDISFTKPSIEAFSVANFGDDKVMYLPAKSIMINGQDFTANAIANSPTSIQATTVTDWYKLLLGNFYNIYLRLNNDSTQFGTIGQTYIQASEPGGDGELITIPLFDPALRRGYQTGSVYKEFIRTDAHRTDLIEDRRLSLDESVTSTAAAGDRTMQIRNFSTADANADALDGSGAYDYTFLVREYDSINNNAEIKYAPWDSIATQMGESIITEEFITTIYDEWWTWYDQLSSTEFSGRGFWELGGDESKCYGTAIGNGTDKVIDLSGKTLVGSWYADGDLLPTTDSSYSCGTLDGAWQYVHSTYGYFGTLYGEGGADVKVATNLLPDGDNTYDLGGANQWQDLWLAGTINIAGTQVVTAQQAAIPDSDGTLSGNTAAINAVINALRAHGLIAS